MFIESVHKPDHELRQIAHENKCFNELMTVRDDVLEYLKTLSIKRDDKSLRRVADIKLRIVNDLNKNCFDKKYQIQSFNEFNIISK